MPKLGYKSPYSHHFSVSLFTPKKNTHILHSANFYCFSHTSYSRKVSPWNRGEDNLIFNHLKQLGFSRAAFRSKWVSFKMDLKRNIYDYKPFLTHTESITH